MRITQWGEYGIHCASFIARAEKQGSKAVPAADIASEQGIALDYAQQILQRLRKNKIVQSIRGPQGGYKLCRPASQITLKDIIVASEGDTFEIICETKPLNHARCSQNAHCNLKPVWFALKDHVNAFLGRYTLEQVVEDTLGLPEIVQQPVQISGTHTGQPSSLESCSMGK